LYTSLDVIGSNNEIKGFMLTKIEIPVDEKGKFLRLAADQIAGKSAQSTYFLKEDFVDAQQIKWFFPYIYAHKDIPYIRIVSSPCLIDPDIPLRYSLQNAFDGDPSTSYVENTEDDLIEIHIFQPEEIAIINGYAQSNTLYQANNRIKMLTFIGGVYDEKTGYYPPAELGYTELEDNNLGFQYFKINITDISSLKVTDIYRGQNYNNTCIAELNIKVNGCWLFGDTNNE
jgi:hypothetical protein